MWFGGEQHRQFSSSQLLIKRYLRRAVHSCASGVVEGDFCGGRIDEAGGGGRRSDVGGGWWKIVGASVGCGGVDGGIERIHEFIGIVDGSDLVGSY